VVITTSMIAGLPLPVTAAQILWINLANDTFPAMALSFDPVDSRQLKAGAANKAGFFDLSSKVLVATVSLVSGLIVVAMFIAHCSKGMRWIMPELSFAFWELIPCFAYS
jgi:Ca2+-transporting ATPase